MRKKKITLYKGQYFFVECAIRTNGNSERKDFLDSLDNSKRAKIIRVINRYADFGKIFNKEKFKKVGGSIFEFKDFQTRILMYQCDRRCIVLTHGFIKKGGRTPKKEIDKANQIMGEYNSVRGGLTAMKNETLYEKYIKDKDFERIMQQEDIIMDVTENFCEILEREKIKKSTLAKFMGKTKGYISQLLGGGRNLTLRSMADLAFHLGYTVKVEFTKKRSLKKQNVHVVNWNVAQKKEMSMPEIKVADDYQYLGDKFSRIAS